MIVYLAQDIAAFVMYCVCGESGSSLLIESTDSMVLDLIADNNKTLCEVRLIFLLLICYLCS